MKSRIFLFLLIILGMLVTISNLYKPNSTENTNKNIEPTNLYPPNLIGRQFFLKNYDGVDYYLSWHELVDDESLEKITDTNTHFFRDNFENRVKLVKDLGTNDIHLIKQLELQLRGGFINPCESPIKNFDKNNPSHTYGSQISKKDCDSIENNEVLVARSQGETSARVIFKINLETGEFSDLYELYVGK